MDSTAIEKLREICVTNQDIKDIEVPAIVVPEDCNIKSLEHLRLNRSRFRGSFKTRSIDDFTQYINDQQESSCFVDAETMTAKAIFNLGDAEKPGHGDHYARLALSVTAPLTALREITDERLTQKAAAEWLEDWRDLITAHNDDDGELEIKKTILAVRNITIEERKKSDYEDGDLRASRTRMEEIEASSKNNALPKYFLFTCEPYEGLPQRTFKVRFSILTGGNEPLLILRIVKMTEHCEQMAQQFKEIIRSQITGENKSIYIGEFNL